MVFKKLLAGLGFGGVEVDTVLSPHPAPANGQLTGQVNLRAKSDTDITAITLILVAGGPMGEIELGRFPVTGTIRVPSGTQQSVPFGVQLPPNTPFTVLYGQNLPGIQLGVRTEVAVATGSAKGDFDPVRVEASPAQQKIMDALGVIGCQFVRNELRPGHMASLPVPAAQAISFYAPIPEGQRPGPHIPQITFTLAGTQQGMTVLAGLAGRPGMPDRHELTTADLNRLNSTDGGWTSEVDRWLISALDKLGSSAAAGAGSGAFLQPQAPAQAPYGHGQPGGYGQPGHGHPGYRQPGYGQPGYAYGGQGQHGYRYGGYRDRPGMGAGGMIAAGVGGAALGFLGGMVVGDMISDAMGPDVADTASAAGSEDPGMADAGFDDFGGGFDEF
jgi:sporulation-control protein